MAIFTLKTGQKTVAASGTPEALVAAKLLARNCKIKALTSNAALVYIGQSGLTTSTGYPLTAGQEVDLTSVFTGNESEIDLNTVFCRVVTNGEGVAFYYL